MKVLVACEESQRVCIAFRKRGHEAYSADIQKPSGGHPEWHIMGDVLPLIDGDCVFTTMDGVKHAVYGEWDLIIAHPPCTYLSNAGACRLYPHKGLIDAERLNKGLDAKDFFLTLYNAKCKKICIENPVPSRIYRLPKQTQVIQPYEYGHPYTKKTYLWIKGLPKLKPTNIVEPKGGWVCGNSEIWKKQALSGEVVGKEKNAKHRSKTFEGIAEAMAEQWGGVKVMKNYHTEICAYCKNEVSVVWDTEHDGYDIYCPACWKKLRLCSACKKYKAVLCDYNEDTGECSMTEEKNNG